MCKKQVNVPSEKCLMVFKKDEVLSLTEEFFSGSAVRTTKLKPHSNKKNPAPAAAIGTPF